MNIVGFVIINMFYFETVKYAAKNSDLDYLFRLKVFDEFKDLFTFSSDSDDKEYIILELVTFLFNNEDKIYLLERFGVFERIEQEINENDCDTKLLAKLIFVIFYSLLERPIKYDTEKKVTYSFHLDVTEFKKESPIKGKYLKHAKSHYYLEELASGKKYKGIKHIKEKNLKEEDWKNSHYEKYYFTTEILYSVLFDIYQAKVEQLPKSSPIPEELIEIKNNLREVADMFYNKSNGVKVSFLIPDNKTRSEIRLTLNKLLNNL
ncbi:MAG: hypothetical protein K9W45_02160 [Candidatus Heimdallarchaeum aukensis]|uniref:Uncharacterized protein n=1 Tax=Candidatus Heimdallarchaeum aukensis TaxID=2876573 RepID=A0A9Y1FLS1_9ARCH|nr:MAG: hypothetical protein K9W45_02160 [Candidatus Heimdallarchaeum aukensis]